VYAGQALGMTYSQNMKLVVLPQAFRNMLPVLLTQTIILFQDTSLVYAIGAYDMLKGFEVAGKNFGRPIEAYLAAAVLYFVMCYALSWAVKRLHQKIASSYPPPEALRAFPLEGGRLPLLRPLLAVPQSGSRPWPAQCDGQLTRVGVKND
jgi:hypothetical protein